MPTDPTDLACATRADDPIERAIALERARREARWLVGAGLEGIRTGQERCRKQKRPRGHVDPAQDWSFAHGCGPTPEAFAATHAGLDVGETAGARAYARARRDWPGFAAAVDDGTVPADCVGQLVAVGSPEHIDAWLALAAISEAEFRRRLPAAERGQSPAGVRAADARVTWGRCVDGSFRASRTLRFTALPARDVWRARQKLSNKLHRPLSLGDLVRELVAVLWPRLGRGLVPRTPADLTPGRLYFDCPEGGDVWVQVNRGAFRIRPEDVPANARPAALAPDGEPILDPTYGSLAAAYPAVAGVTVGAGAFEGTRPAAAPADADAPAPEGRDAARSTLNAEHQPVEYLAGPDPTRALAAIADEARQLPDAWGPEHLRAATASSGRTQQRLRAEIVICIAEVVAAIQRGERPADDRERLRIGLGWTLPAFDEAVRVGGLLPDLPELRAAFLDARVGWAAMRAVAHKATPATDAGWAECCERWPVGRVQAWAAALKPGDPAPRAPLGHAPLRPLGDTVTEKCRVRLSPDDADRFAQLQQIVERVIGGPVSPAELLAALAGWWCKVFDNEIARPWVIYQPAPDTRAAPPGARLRPEIAALADSDARLRAAFPRLAAALEGRRHAAETPSAPSPESREPSPLRKRHTRRDRRAVEARDGERCQTPDCPRDLTLQIDHFFELSEGGHVQVPKDHRFCCTCNTCKHLREIRVILGGDGSVTIADRWLRPVGSVRLGVNWDGAVRVWCEARAARVEGLRAARAGLSAYPPRRSGVGADAVRERRAIWTFHATRPGLAARGHPPPVPAGAAGS